MASAGVVDRRDGYVRRVRGLHRYSLRYGGLRQQPEDHKQNN